jgi:hypothetical protein
VIIKKLNEIMPSKESSEVIFRLNLDGSCYRSRIVPVTLLNAFDYSFVAPSLFSIMFQSITLT